MVDFNCEVTTNAREAGKCGFHLGQVKILLLWKKGSTDTGDNDRLCCTQSYPVFLQSISHYSVLGFADTNPSFPLLCLLKPFCTLSSQLHSVLVFPAFGPQALFFSHSVDLLHDHIKFTACTTQVLHTYIFFSDLFFLNSKLIYPTP